MGTTKEAARGQRFPRTQDDLKNLRRSPAQSHFRTQGDLLREEDFPGKPPRHKLRDFLRVKVWKWISHYFRSRFGKRVKFKNYGDSPVDTGIYRLEGTAASQPQPVQNEIRISLAADWGTGTLESQEIAHLMAAFDPHHTIHLGDVYYVGTKKEVRENFFSPVAWPLGSLGSFALNGNHEMYARGIGYFTVLLDKLGMRNPANGQFGKQKASFFCLENDFWRIIGLDTGYNSIRKIPLMERIIPPTCKFPDALISWLRDHVKPAGDKRGLILLTHHQYYSAFERGYKRPARQLAEFINRPVLWFWGHEHRLAIYGKYAEKRGIEAFGRCIGHGGMPIQSIGKKPRKRRARKRRLVIYDARFNRKAGKIRVGFNGFVNLTLQGEQLLVDYRDIQDRSLLTEKWAVDLSTGTLTRLGIQQHEDLPVPEELDLPDLKTAQS